VTVARRWQRLESDGLASVHVAVNAGVDQEMARAWVTVADARPQGVQRVCDSDDLVVGFLRTIAATDGLSPDTPFLPFT
jgi:hypothetical protein